MELSKGVCFCCDSDRVLLNFEHMKVHKIISSLFSSDLLNAEELDRVLSYLEICPFCYHKLLILGRTNKNLKGGISSSHKRKCVMCRGGEVLFHIAKWPHFKTISQDVKLEHEHKFEMCSDCLFYLDLRYTFKETILSKCPELKPKLKLKIQNIVPSPSILKVENGKSTKKYKRLRFSDVDESIDSPISTPVVDFSAIQSFKPLKYNRSIKRSNTIINKDPKFIDQIPYVLVAVTNLMHNRENVISKKLKENDVEEEIITTSSPTKGLKIKFKTKRKKLGKQLSKEITEVDSKPACVETVLQKYHFKKDLIVNLPKILNANRKSMRGNTLLNKSKNDSIPTDNCQLISDQDAKGRLSESSNDEEYTKDTDTTTDIVESESDQLNLAPKRKKYSPKPLSKQKNNTVDLSDDSIHQTQNDERCGNLEKSNIYKADEIKSTVDPDGENHMDTNDDNSNIESNENGSTISDEETVDRSSENVEDKKDNLDDDNKGVNKRQIKRRQSLYDVEDCNNCRDSNDDEETVDGTSENIENTNDNSDEDNKGIKKLRIKRRDNLHVKEDNGDQSESEKTSKDACLNEKETEISTEKTAGNVDEDNEENVEDNEDNVEDNEENVEDNEENVEDNEENVEDNVEGVEDANELHEEEEIADPNSDEAANNGEGSVDGNTEKEEIDNEKLIEEVDDTASNIAQEETVDTKSNTNDVVDDSSGDTKISTVDKDNIKNIISFLEDSGDKEGKGNTDKFEDKDDDSNSSGSKRKHDDDDEDEINTSDSAEKKKKKVTFSEDV